MVDGKVNRLMYNDIKIIYEDNHLLVIEKPINILSQKDETNDKDVITILKEYLKEKYNKLGNAYLGLVHRLDRPVGGVMVLAKTSKAASRLSEQIRKNEFEKIYFAVVHGVLSKKRGTLVNFLLKNKKDNIVKVVSEGTAGAKKAILEYEMYKNTDRLSWVKIRLHTGRAHQIRVQFASLGHPLYGDQKYGKDKNKVGNQIALWSTEITFLHPITKQNVTFKSEPIKDHMLSF